MAIDRHLTQSVVAGIIDRSGAGVVRFMKPISSGHGKGMRGRVEQRTKVENQEDLP